MINGKKKKERKTTYSYCCNFSEECRHPILLLFKITYPLSDTPIYIYIINVAIKTMTQQGYYNINITVSDLQSRFGDKLDWFVPKTGLQS